MFNSIFATSTTINLTAGVAFLCLGISLICGTALALSYYFSEKCTKGMFMAITMIPMVTTLIIILVNGDIGMGLTVAGVFGFIRFRSYQGSAREMIAIFYSMALGFVIGRGFLIAGACFAVIGCALIFGLSKLPIDKIEDSARNITITVPESLNYSNAFDDLFEKYTEKSKLIKVKTSGMGTLYELSYSVEMKKGASEKEFIDAIRCRNANLSVICCIPTKASEGL